jgi:hypothetical protein
MVRKISAASLALLAQPQGIEPINTLEIQWSKSTEINLSNFPTTGVYADKAYPDFGIDGRIIELSNLENVVNFYGGSSSQSLKVKLDDTDGQLKRIFDNVDIHKIPVWVKQWFGGLPYSEAFVIFEGELSSPIVWNEGDRTLAFDVVSKVEDVEVGFSAEEGNFNHIPQYLIGKAWPLCFGTVLDLPVLNLDKIPAGVLSKDLMLADCYSKHDKDYAKANEAMALGQQWLMAALADYSIAEQLKFENFKNYTGDIQQTVEAYIKKGDENTNRGNQFLIEGQQIRIRVGNEIQQCAEHVQNLFDTLQIIGGAQYQQNTFMTIGVKGATVSGVMQGENFQVQSFTRPNNPPILGPLTVQSRAVAIEYDQDQVGLNTDFFYAYGGTQAFLASPLAWRYIVAGVIPVSILGVRAWQTSVDPDNSQLGIRQLMPVPGQYFSAGQVNFNGVNATVLTLNQPLSSIKLPGITWEDELFVTVQSPIGPNPVDVITWFIQTYTDHGIDTASFNTVRGQLANYPVNFALTNRKNVKQVVEEIAYLSRCAIYLKSGVFFLKYLSMEETPVDTISESDVLHQSLEITTIDTESLYTKVTATWKDLQSLSEPNFVVIRSNILKYGLKEKTIDYYIYNNVNEVVKSATFWLIRDSNSFKILHIKVPLTKLPLETWDTILLNFSNNYIANGPVIGIIQNCQFDSKDNTIDLTVWVPVRLGEMTKFPYALAAGSTIDLIFPNSDAAHAVGGGDNLGGYPSERGSGVLPGLMPQELTELTPQFFNTNQSDQKDMPPPTPPTPGGGGTQIVPGTGIPKSLLAVSTTKRDYNWKDFFDDAFGLTPGVYPGQVTGPGDDPEHWHVNVYFNGLKGDATDSIAKQLFMWDGDVITKGTWVLINRCVIPNPDAQGVALATTPPFIYELTMQIPVWMDFNQSS